MHNRNVVLEEEKSSAIASKLKDRIKTIIDRKSTQRKINRKPTIGIHDKSINDRAGTLRGRELERGRLASKSPARGGSKPREEEWKGRSKSRVRFDEEVVVVSESKGATLMPLKRKNTKMHSIIQSRFERSLSRKVNLEGESYAGSEDGAASFVEADAIEGLSS